MVYMTLSPMINSVVERVLKILEEPIVHEDDPQHPECLVKTLYRQCLDTNRMDADGAAPVSYISLFISHCFLFLSVFECV